MNQTPIISYAGGVVVYLSKTACSILINEMKSINWNIFVYHPSIGFPFIIEDIGVGFALLKNNILPFKYNLYTDSVYNPENIENDKKEDFIAYHTNKYK
jgi:hypothetical protein